MTIVITNSVVAVHCKSDCMHVSLDLAFADRNHIYLMSNEHSLTCPMHVHGYTVVLFIAYPISSTSHHQLYEHFICATMHIVSI